ncbi:MAG: hypothetical protein A2751_02850 [Candidatus Doudnabacteria bacterium RIFCSPHIGHO2_01_FULL_46_14]|uniref:Glycosyltransferase RgtA/B/C/D-like domain-containing protein n=1 Tax=Candidatus Doudnabacteria bacterium RIFCSPHIGHO2_01_FULL_46_14 TaxID=1817824 RepID=A0A1F5NJY0_9BACT|nr:MAG: hypothetical protein A2751_02850 [Candidatus Doudnabacteria bacterium RIFCSPHIGHO2_01_FULL_46_14]
MRKIFIIFFVWLVIANLFAVAGANRFNLESDTAYAWIDPAKAMPQQTWDITSLHVKWDSYWHMDIAQNGYSFAGPGQLSNLVFFPVYAFVIRLIDVFVAGDAALAGWLASAVALLGALIFFYKLVKEFHPDVDAYQPLIFLLIFPTAFFLNAVYTEAVFLLLSLACFYYAFRKNFLLAGLFGLAASLTRVTGVLLFVPLLWQYYQLYGVRFTKNFLPLMMIPAGLFGFFLFHYLRFGDALLFFKIESTWGRNFTVNTDHFVLTGHPAIVNLSLDLLFIAFAILVTYFVFRKLNAAYGLYMLATVTVALGSGSMMSIGRYILVLFPIFILLARIKNEYIKLGWAFTSILLFALYTMLFVNYYWAG